MEICRKAERVPCYIQVCRRMKTLALPKKLLAKRGMTDPVLDTTALKIYGAGEWRSKKYGGKAGRMLIKGVGDSGKCYGLTQRYNRSL